MEQHEAEQLARTALRTWQDPHAERELHVTRLAHGWRFEVPRGPQRDIGGSHPAVTTSGQVLRVPDGLPDEVVDEFLADAETASH